MLNCYPWKFKKNNNQSLSDITRGLLYSANAAQQILNTHYLESIGKYFDDEGNPLMFNFKISENKEASIPMLAMTEPKGLRLKEIEINLNVRIDEGKIKTKDGINEKDLARYGDRTSFEVTLAPNTKDEKGRTANTIGIKLKFEEQENPEGIERIMDEFRNKPILYREISKNISNTKKDMEEDNLNETIKEDI